MIKRITLHDAAGGAADTAAVQVVRCTVLAGLSPDAEYAEVLIEWFADGCEAAPGTAVLVEEVVVRGAEWLRAHRQTGRPAFKHMAFAVRADGLTPAEFAARWRAHAGQHAPADAPALVIPEKARGHAYVQNHPVPRASGEWPYDAVNEVWFDDVDALRQRVEFFADNPTGHDLFGRSWLVAVREEIER